MSAAPRLDPAEDAARLLRRLGFAVLGIALPPLALVSRRAPAIVVPIGAALLVLAWLLDPRGSGLVRRLTSAVRSPAGLALSGLLLWALLSLLWTPFQADAAERLLAVAAAAALAVAGALAMPDRLRASTLNLFPLGAALGGLGACLLVAGFRLRWWQLAADTDGPVIERGLVVVGLLALASVGWLHSRDRSIEAVLLAGVCAVAVLLAGSATNIAAFAAGLAVFALALAGREPAARGVALGLAGLVLLAPLIVVGARPIAVSLLGPAHPAALGLATLADMIAAQPTRLLTGHGFDTALRGQVARLLPANLPRSALVELWYELGLVGAGALASVLALLARRARRLDPGVAAALLGVLVCGFVTGAAGVGVLQIWWLSALGAAALSLRAIERGQFRTTRPVARLFRRQAAAEQG